MRTWENISQKNSFSAQICKVAAQPDIADTGSKSNKNV